MAEGKKTLWEKEKLFVVSNFSFSRSVFKRFVMQTRKKNQGVFGTGLNGIRSRWDFTGNCDRASETAEEDQTAGMCRLILLYTHHNV